MSLLTRYSLQVECLLSWFPVKSTAVLKETRIRAYTFRYINDDQTFVIGNRIGEILGEGLDGRDDSLAPGKSVRAIIDTGVDQDDLFSVNLEVGVGRAIRKQHFMFRPDIITPLLISVRAHPEDEELRDTVVAFQGVVTTGHRFSFVSDVLTDVFKGFGRT